MVHGTEKIRRRAMSPAQLASALLFSVSALALAGSSEDAQLIQAVKDSNRQAVQSLLEHHASPNARETNGTTALEWAVGRNDRETVELLIGAGADVKAVNRYG